MDQELRQIRSSTQLPLFSALYSSFQVVLAVACLIVLLLRHALIVDNASVDLTRSSNGQHASSIRGGTIIIAPSDSQGISLELARRLSGASHHRLLQCFISLTSLYFTSFSVSSSVHILLGVESESEVRTLQFEGIRSKGIEPIVFDREDVNDFAKVVYRSKEVLRDLNRPLLGIVVNLLDDPKQSST